MIVTIRTDKPEAEIGLYKPNGEEITYQKWQAHRELSQTILIKIKTILKDNKSDFEKLSGVVFYEGPGSFTGLRIGASVANALEVPVVNTSGDDWQRRGTKLLKEGKKSTATPNYGREPHITKPKK